ncbi:MAG: MBL fold metallo-hydrolase [Candidatus Auribacterota bacterium]|nr:MBL fold metallo-hydrolase [Candidatus Auribacterota bacterium]
MKTSAPKIKWILILWGSVLVSLLSPPSIYSSDFPASVTPLQVIVVDVGHGDCIWIKTPDDGIEGNGRYEGRNIIIDGGPSSKRIMGLLDDVGLKRNTTIDWLFCTHAHQDHYRGPIAILDNFRVKRIVDPGFRSRSTAYGAFCWRSFIEPGAVFYSPAIGAPPILGLKSLGDKVPYKLDWGQELKVEILYSNPFVNKYTINLSSIVLRLEYKFVSFLFTGDAEGKYRRSSPVRAGMVEKFLLDHYTGEGRNELKSTILKIAHHGSETSGTTPFIKAVQPKEGIICVGNRYNLPDESVMKRYRDNGCRIWRTDRLDKGKSASQCSGDDHVIIITDGIDYSIKYMKQDEEEGKLKLSTNN